MKKPKYYLSPKNEFVIENYNAAPTFASFFPGIAGIFGCPLWVFYANRGQAITSAGIQDKDHSLMEFQSANKAYRSVALNGFRTFIKTNGSFYEPFAENSPFKNEMRISSHGLRLIEVNPRLELKIEIDYFTLPHESFPALARILKITNLGNRSRKLEIVDGLPIIIPFGFTDDLLKKICLTTAAWCKVENLDHAAPFYRLKAAPADVCETQTIEKGNFYLSFSTKGKINYIVEPKLVFGETGDLETPDNFIHQSSFTLPSKQLTEGFLPSAFAFSKSTLAPGKTHELFSLFGQADNLELLMLIKKRVLNPKYFDEKFKENQVLIEEICSLMKTESASKSFDLYAKQTFLDNVMRGGLPVDIDDRVVYLYYRKHGDMERDYNNFKLMPTYLSQGNGNYRDIIQNRRNDVFFNPNLADDNIIRFFNLIQMDGFNPLVVLASQYTLKSTEDAKDLVAKHIKNAEKWLAEFISQPFLLGYLLKNIEDAGLQYKTCRETFLEELLERSETEEMAVHGEGFWTDHFFYNIDLLESFESIYPEKIRELLFKKKDFTFFDNEYVVRPRKDKCCLACGSVRQYESVYLDLEKQALINNRLNGKRNVVRTKFGRGAPYFTTLLTKILCLAANKAASFDVEGIGLEMEADKPDWYDALNGLPALFGSSLSETLELKRMCNYVLKRLSDEVEASLPVELKNFIDRLNPVLRGPATFSSWQMSNQLKEDYRLKTRLGISGREKKVSREYLAAFLINIVKKCDQGTRKCLKKYHNYYTYFMNEALDYEALAGNKARIKKFKQKPLPLFLEGFVHALKVEQDRRICRLVKKSSLYDRKLNMYRVTSSLKDAPVEIGRAKFFTPGWLENESIWLHMEYKYLLELLKAGMHREFFAEFKNILIPFMDPQQYRRSILENSSFIVSSVHPNKKLHGRGFYARLSGASAEFIEIWLYLTTGKKIFNSDQNGRLSFQLAPILPSWLFKNGRFTFTLLGSIEVAYLNPKGKNTFGRGGVSPVSYRLRSKEEEIVINQSCIEEPYSRLIRDRKFEKIIVELSCHG